MLIIGAKGFAKETLEILSKTSNKNIAFYDDVNEDIGQFLFGQFPILKKEIDVLKFFERNGSQFILGLGNPLLRYKLWQKFERLGGECCSAISSRSFVGRYDVEIGAGTNILPNSSISNSVKIGKGCILYYGVVVTHDVQVGSFVELSPNVCLLGNVQVGDFCHLGASATVLPKLKIGRNVVVGAGAVVTENIPDNSVVVGVPAKKIKSLNPIEVENE